MDHMLHRNNLRCREKPRKEASCLQKVNMKLTAMNKLLLEENDRLQKQPGPDSFGVVVVSSSSNGVASRAYGLVSLELTKVTEILKDRLSWFHDCRCADVTSTLTATDFFARESAS